LQMARWTLQLAIHLKIFPIPAMKERDLRVAAFLFAGFGGGGSRSGIRLSE
jgi:hypothetical protein